MSNLQKCVNEYLEYCKNQRRLDTKTLRAYQTDLKQFIQNIKCTDIALITPDMLEDYIADLHSKFASKTVKRKIASVKAFFNYLEFKDLIDANPFRKIKTKFREPVMLPKTISLNTIERFLTEIYKQRKYANTECRRVNALRDVAVAETLFATGMRISELCSLKVNNVDLQTGDILIYGKGSKERKIQIGNQDVLGILVEYRKTFDCKKEGCNNFFVNRNGTPISSSAVRRMITKYCKLASIDQHITPHMFRHTFATSLLEEDVDIRYIQEMLGHSSINVTEIYTHVATEKQRSILVTKHPRNKLHI